MNPSVRPPVIVVGYLYADASQRAVEVAAELARDLGGTLKVVHVIDLVDFPVDPDLPDWEQHGARRLREEEQEVERMLRPWRIDGHYEVRRGNPARALAAAASESAARFIVVGTRMRSGLGAALEHLLTANRSVSHALERAEVPVIVVPARPAGAPRNPPRD